MPGCSPGSRPVGVRRHDAPTPSAAPGSPRAGRPSPSRSLPCTGPSPATPSVACAADAGARRVVHEERPVRSERSGRLHPVDRLVGHVDVEVVVRVARGADVGRPVDQVRVQRRLLAGQVAVELVPSAVGRPPVERPTDAHLVRRHLVALAEVAGHVSPPAQDLADRRATVGPHAGVARDTPVLVSTTVAHVHWWLIAARQQRHPGRRAERIDMEVRVLSPLRASRSSVGIRIGPPNVDGSA